MFLYIQNVVEISVAELFLKLTISEYPFQK